MTINSDSYQSLVASLRRTPRSASILPDAHLLKIAKHLPCDPALSAPVLGELLVRQWLYVSEFGDILSEVTVPAMSSRVMEIVGNLLRDPQKGARVRSCTIEVPDDIDGFDKKVLCHFAERISRFMASDGIIAVVAGSSGEVVPLPFSIIRKPTSLLPVTDEDGTPIEGWSTVLVQLRDIVGEDIGLRLLCSCGDRVMDLSGDSLMLPVAMAHASLCVYLPDYPPLKVIATGGLRGGGLTLVSGLEAKAHLAKKLGAVYIAPECLKESRSLSLPVGTPYKELLACLDGFLRDQGLASMTSKIVAERIDQLYVKVGEGNLSLNEADRKLDQYCLALDKATEDVWVRKGKAKASILRGAIANHSADPARARVILAEAAKTCAAVPVLYAESCANLIVSLTDLGEYDEAEKLGRELLAWIGTGFVGSSEDEARCRMFAIGALGGQTLLCKALLGAGTGPESLELLSGALSLAEELASVRDICMDSVQIALWHALLSPEKSLESCAKASKRLAKFPASERSVSEGYLNRVRFLGGYRALLNTGVIAKGFEEWELPNAAIGHLGWVRAAALKYRGALLAASGKTDAAKADFNEAIARFDNETAPLLRFIGGTAALQAAESLSGVMCVADYLNTAKRVFAAFENWFPQPISGKTWAERALAAENGRALEGCSAPQMGFPY